MEDETEIKVPLEMYKNEVFNSADNIEAFYNSCALKKLSEDEGDWERQVHLLFWEEWNRRRNNRF